MSRAAYEEDLQAWLAQVVPVGTEVVYARQKEAPRPGGTFVTLQVTSLDKRGTPTDRVGDTETAPGSGLYEGRQRHEYAGVCDVSCYGPDHRQVAEAIEQSLHLPATLGLLTERTRPASIGPMRDLTGLVGPQWEGRTQFEVDFLHSAITEYDAETVETVEATPQVG